MTVYIQWNYSSQRTLHFFVVSLKLCYHTNHRQSSIHEWKQLSDAHLTAFLHPLSVETFGSIGQVHASSTQQTASHRLLDIQITGQACRSHMHAVHGYLAILSKSKRCHIIPIPYFTQYKQSQTMVCKCIRHILENKISRIQSTAVLETSKPLHSYWIILFLLLS